MCQLGGRVSPAKRFKKISGLHIGSQEGSQIVLARGAALCVYGESGKFGIGLKPGKVPGSVCGRDGLVYESWIGNC